MNYDYIKNRKRFYVHSYRRALRLLMVSLILNGGILLGIGYQVISEPERDFYATDGISAPVKLTPLLQPNASPNALLTPDPIVIRAQKVIPN